MALDETLLARAEQGDASFRIYFWDKPTLSLGYFQPASERLHHPELAQLPFVRRMTGGGAIVHGQKLPLANGVVLTDRTYALALPRELLAGQSACSWHDRIHRALAAVLTQLGVVAEVIPRLNSCCGTSVQIVSGRAANSQEGEVAEREFLCFARPAPGDVVWQGRKIAGSAQRLCRNALLQHGSITLSHWPCDLESLAQLWLAALGWNMQKADWTAQQMQQAECLAQSKYRQPDWNFRR